MCHLFKLCKFHWSFSSGETESKAVGPRRATKDHILDKLFKRSLMYSYAPKQFSGLTVPSPTSYTELLKLTNPNVRASTALVG